MLSIAPYNDPVHKGLTKKILLINNDRKVKKLKLASDGDIYSL